MAAVEEQPEQPLCIHFTNTVSLHDGVCERDWFLSFPDFVSWAGAAGLLTRHEVRRWTRWGEKHRTESARILSTAVQLREHLYELFCKSAAANRIIPSELDELNRILAAPGLRRTLQLSDEAIAASWDCGDDLWAPIRRVALSAADVLLDGSWRRIIRCGGEHCDWLAVDTSRNHSRHYCTATGCGNRTRVKRHYRRLRSQAKKVRLGSALG